MVKETLTTNLVSGKWVNYLGVLMGMGFDWLLVHDDVAVPARDYAPWESKTHNIYAHKAKKAQERRAATRPSGAGGSRTIPDILI